MRITLTQCLQAHELHHFTGLGFHDVAGNAADFETIANVFAHPHVGKQGIRLEHHGDVTLGGGQPGHVFVADQDAPGGRCFQAGNHAQCGGLAAARGAEQGGQAAGFKTQRDIVNSRLALRVVAFDNLLQHHRGGIWKRKWVHVDPANAAVEVLSRMPRRPS